MSWNLPPGVTQQQLDAAATGSPDWEGRCPSCGAPEVDTTDEYPLEGWVYRELLCTRCGERWSEAT